MLYIGQTISSNMIAIIILSIIIANISKNKKYVQVEYSYLSKLIFINIVLCVFEGFANSLEGVIYQNSYFIEMVLYTICYTHTIVFAKSFLEYSFIRAYSKEEYDKKKKLKVLTSIPMYIIFILLIINIFVPTVFKVDKDTMIYTRAFGYYVSLVFTYLYIFFATFIAYYYKKVTKHIVFGSALTFIIPVIIASILQLIFNHLSVLWVGTSIGLFLIYLSLQDDFSMVDELSGLYTRRYMDNYLKHLLQIHNKNELVVGILIDIDKFKLINDNYGHSLGDQAISVVGEILRKICKTKFATPVRYGGDEFIVFMKMEYEDEEQLFINALTDELARFNDMKILPFVINFSSGYAVYRQSDSIASFFARMDVEMYKMKKTKDDQLI